MMNRRLAFGLLAATALLSALPVSAAGEAKPEATLATVLGEWRGSLSYRDYSQPERIVTLPTKAYVSMIAPDELAVHLVYDDGPGKTVYAYERLRFELASDTMIWVSGAAERTALVGRVVATANEGGVRRYVVDSTKDRALIRFTFEFGPASFTMKRDEIDAAGKAVNRNRYSFQRPL